MNSNLKCAVVIATVVLFTYFVLTNRLDLGEGSDAFKVRDSKGMRWVSDVYPTNDEISTIRRISDTTVLARDSPGQFAEEEVVGDGGDVDIGENIEKFENDEERDHADKNLIEKQEREEEEEGREEEVGHDEEIIRNYKNVNEENVDNEHVETGEKKYEEKKIEEDKTTDTPSIEEKRDYFYKLGPGDLVNELRIKLSEVPVSTYYPKNVTYTCGLKQIAANGCGESMDCKFRTRLSESLEDRISEVALNPKLQIAREHQEAIYKMGDQLKGNYDFIIATAASSNHYNEVQGTFLSLFEYLKTDMKYALVILDIGLTPEEKKKMQLFCNCTIVTFPFHLFPPHISTLRCYGWKPTGILAFLRKTSVLIWMDASIRMMKRSNDLLHADIKTTKLRGVQQKTGRVVLARNTLVDTMHYFGDEPCAFTYYKMASANFGFYRNEPFVRQAILGPWVGCALKAKCMCPIKDPDTVIHCHEEPAFTYGECHRFDQSVISIILSKLYQRAVDHVLLPRGSVLIRRGLKLYYFEDLYGNRTGTDTDVEVEDE